MQVYNSGTSVVKPQRSTGICEVSYSGFLIRCKALTDPLRQQKNQNQLGDVTHCLLIFICSSHWLREREQRDCEPGEWNESVREKGTRQEGFVEINSEWKGNRGAESWQRDQRERWWRWYGRFTQITHVVFVSSADILRYSSLIFVPQPNGMEVISILSGFKVLPMKIVDRVVCGFSRITSIFPLERQVDIQIININIYLFLKKVSALNNIPFTSVALGKQQIDRKPKVSLW